MSQKLRRILVIMIVFGVIWGGLSLAFPKRKPQPDETQPEATPTLSESRVEEELTDTEIINSIRARLPVRSRDFGIVYFKSSGQFGVTIYQGNYEKQKQKALNWFAEQGVVNLEELPILWSATRWVTD